MSVVLLFQKRTIFIQQCVEGYALTFVGPGEEQRDLGTLGTLGSATTAAKTEAFRIGRCRVHVLGTEGRV